MNCQNCDHGVMMIPVQHEEYITREMALDAGDPTLEGSTLHLGAEWAFDTCDCCLGQWEECPVCSAPSKSVARRIKLQR